MKFCPKARGIFENKKRKGGMALLKFILNDPSRRCTGAINIPSQGVMYTLSPSFPLTPPRGYFCKFQIRVCCEESYPDLF